MKLIQRSFALLSLALLATACDLQQTFDERIDDKQLLVLTPDFADTSVQLVFRDPETLAVLDEDFEVTVYSNKRLVDLNGNYKNEFIARGGVMEFSISPEETVSESDPLELLVNAASQDKSLFTRFHGATIKTKGFRSLLLTPEAVPSFNELELNQKEPSQISPKIALTNEAREAKSAVLFNGNFIANYSSPYCDIGPCIRNWTEYLGSINPKKNYIVYGDDLGIIAFFDAGGLRQENIIDSPLTLDIKASNFLLAGDFPTFKYNLQFYFERGSSKDGFRYFIDERGTYVRQELVDFSIVNTNIASFSGYRHSVTIPSQVEFGYVVLISNHDVNVISCSQGINFKFEGLEVGEETTLFYDAIKKDDGERFAIALINASGPNYSYNSLQDANLAERHLMGKTANQIIFAENSQYFIEPQVIDLGGEEACGNTYTVRLKRRDTHKKHQLNLSMRNENQNVGLALTFSALLRKQGQDDTAWETVNFKQGSTSVYLEEGSTYEVKLTLADEPFEFTFTNDLSLVEAAVQATLRNVTRIKDINYTINQTAELNTIDAEIVFYEGQSLID